MNIYCEAATSSTNDRLLDDSVVNSNDAEYVNAEVYDSISSRNAMNCCEGGTMPDSTTEGYGILLPDNNNHNNDVFAFANMIEGVNSYKEFSKNNNINDCKNVQLIHIKEEVIVDSIVSGHDYSNEINEMITDESTLKLIPSQSLQEKMTLIDEYNAQKDEIRSANNFIKRQKRNEVLKFLRMYCTECVNVGSNNDVPGLKKKCFKCTRLLKFKCLKCKARFKKYKTAYYHVKFRCINESLLKCSKCNYTTVDERNLLSHTKYKHGNNQCIKCGDKLKNYTSLRRHQMYQCKYKTQRITRKLDIYSFMEHFCKTCDKIISKGQRSFFKKCSDCMQYSQMQCSKCKHPCSNNMAAYVHLKFKCEVLNLSCHLCNYKTPKKIVLQKHLLDLHLPQKCKVCNEICNGKTSLRLHRYKLHKEQRVARKKVKASWLQIFCSNCDKVLSRENLKIEEKCPDCTSTVLYQCKTCTKRYAYKSSIYSHYYKTHGIYAKRKESNVKCSMCENTIPFKNLRKHFEKTHTVIKCTKCDVKCENYDFWMKHKTEECSFKDNNPVKCSICDFLTTNKDLEKHIRYQHTAIDCPKCGMKLANSSMLKQHLRIECIFGHKANINCPTCNILIRMKNLNKHIALKHTLDAQNQRLPSNGNGSFQNCTLCGFVFISIRELQKHKKYIHNTWTCSQCSMKCDNFYYMKKHQLHECSFSNQQQSSATNCKSMDINIYCTKCCVTTKMIYALKVSTCSVCQNVLKYQCGTCKNNFKSYYGVQAHIKNVCSVEPTLPCPNCNHKERTEYMLKRHIKKCVKNSNQNAT